MASKKERVSTESIEKKLTSFNSTQESVQATSLWIMHNKSQHKKIVDTWLKVVKASSNKHRLTLFYLCNDVVQHAKKKKALYYLENFKDNLREAVHVIRDSGSIKPNILRIFKIWEERRTYDAKFITELRKILDNAAPIAEIAGDSSKESSSANATPNTPKPVVSPAYKPSPKVEQSISEVTQLTTEGAATAVDFKPSMFVEEMTALRKLETEVSLKTKQLASLRIDATNIEAIKQLKDRSHGNEFCNQFEESCQKIEDYVTVLEKEIEQGRQVLSFCDAAETFYDEQFKEAKIVANAYKNFGARVTNMKKRVDDMKKIIPTTPSPVPSPSADAPSPGNTPPLQDMDDNDMVDMELCEENGETDKMLEPGSYMQQRVAYTSMVKSIAQPIPSVTDIVIGDSEKAPEEPKKEEDSPAKPPSVTDTFQGSNLLESRIASMLPNLAKGNSSVGLGIGQPPAVVKTLEDYVPPKPSHKEGRHERRNSNHSSSKRHESRHDSGHESWRNDSKHDSHSDSKHHGRHSDQRHDSNSETHNDSDDRSSTPVQDEQDEKEPEPPKASRASSKPAPTKVKTNPIDFLSQLLTKSSNTSSSSNFLQSLSLLTNTVKTQFQKKKEEDDKGSGGQPAEIDMSNPEPPTPQAPPVGAPTPYSAVPPPEPMAQNSSWPDWKNIALPAQPPLPQGPEPTSPPTMPPASAPADIPPQPPPPQHPPLPPEPIRPVHQPMYPIQPPSQQDFSLPPPLGSKFPSTSPPAVSQSFMPPAPPSQPYMVPQPSSQPSFQVASSSQSFSVGTTPTQAFPVQPPVSAGASRPPLISPQHMITNPGFPFPGVRPPISAVSPGVLPPRPAVVRPQQFPSHSLENAPRLPGPWGQEQAPTNQAPGGNYGNQMPNNEVNTWNRQGSVEEVDHSEGYVHPWDEPHNYEEDDEDDNDISPQSLAPPPKGILRNSRSSSLREVTLVDENMSNSPVPVQSEFKAAGILKKLSHLEHFHKEQSNDVQSEFIAKLKQKSHSNIDIPPPPFHHNSGAGDEGVHVSNTSHGEAISTIGVIGNSGRTSSVKSDDMDMDLDEMDSNNDSHNLIELGSHEEWQHQHHQQQEEQLEQEDTWEQLEREESWQHHHHQNQHQQPKQDESWKHQHEDEGWEQHQLNALQHQQQQQHQQKPPKHQQQQQHQQLPTQDDSWHEDSIAESDMWLDEKLPGGPQVFGRRQNSPPPHSQAHQSHNFGSGPRGGGMAQRPYGRGGAGGHFDSFRPRGPPKQWSRPQHFDNFQGPSPAKRPFFSPRQRRPYYRY